MRFSEILKTVNWRKVSWFILATSTLALCPVPVMAADLDIASKFDPIIDVMKQLARPVAQGAFIYAGIQYCLGQRNKAGMIVKGTVVGYLFIQWSPMLMTIIDEVGKMS